MTASASLNHGVLTGQDTSAPLAKAWDGQKLQDKVQAQATITAEFGRNAARAIGDYAASKTQAVEDARNYAQYKGAQANGEASPTAVAWLDKMERSGYSLDQAQAVLNDPQALADYDHWKEGGAYRVAAHTVVGGLTGDVQGAMGAATGSALAPTLNDMQASLQSQLASDGINAEAAKNVAKLVTDLAAMTAGAAAAGGSSAGAAAAFNEDANNRQLHPSEAALIKRNAAIYAKQRGLSVEQAEVLLTQQALRQIDSAWDTRFGPADADASAFLQSLGAGPAVITDRMTGQGFTLFTATEAQRNDHAQFSQYAATSTVAALYDKAADRANKPKNGQTIEAGLSGSQMALNDAARDTAHMKAQPVQVQRAVLGELRGQRQALTQEYGRLQNELQGPITADRRGTVLQRMSELENQDQRLLKATVMQILDMAQAGHINPIQQREWTEGFGAALGAARLGLGMRSPIGARVDMLKGAMADAKAAADAAAAEAAAVGAARLGNNVYRDDGVADPGKPMSAAGPWTPAAAMTPVQADAAIGSGLPGGAKVVGVHSADAANAQAQSTLNYSPPFVPGTQIVEITTTQPTQFVRVFVNDAQQTGGWIMRAEDIQGLTAQQIASKYALPEVPTMVTDVTVPSGTRLEVSMANGISPNAAKTGTRTGDNGGGGGVQFQIKTEFQLRTDFEKLFTNARPLPTKGGK